MSSLEASQAAVADSIAENKTNGKNGENGLEPGEIQEVEVDMQAHAESIRTVFNDPTNFNVKASILSHIIADGGDVYACCRRSVYTLYDALMPFAASPLLPMGPLVRLTGNEGPQLAPNPDVVIPSDSTAADPECGSGGLDGRHQAGDRL